MRDSNADSLLPEHIARLLDEAVKQALFLQQAQPFMAWFHAQVQASGAALLPDAPPQTLRCFAQHLGAGLWNHLPLPRNRFRPEPLPKPARNDPCPCGANNKFKQCRGVPPLPLDAEMVWQLAIKHISREQLREAIAQRQIPLMTLAMLADEHLEQGRGRQAMALLEPVFDAELPTLDHRHADLLNLLCNAYDDVYRTPARKLKLLERLSAAPHNAVRANAWQRLASFRMDQGRDDEAWRCFQEAQRADPGDPSLAHLELLLLLSRGEHQRARERARFWQNQFRRQGIGDPEMMEFLDAAARDPAQAFARFAQGHRDPHLVELEALIGRAPPHDLSAYRSESLAASEAGGSQDMLETLRRSLKGMGVSAADIEKQLPQMRAQIEQMAHSPPPMADAEDAASQSTDEHRLVAPAQIAALEERWHAAYPVGKPMSTQPLPMGDTEPWTQREAGRWIAFLRECPQALNSLDVLDDLVMAMDLHGQPPMPGAHPQIAAPLLDRAMQILRRAVLTAPGITIPWGVADNRPALRLLSRQIDRLLDQRDEAAATRLIEWMLALNPNDNHGYRCLLMNQLLRSGDDARAVGLWEQYADDSHNPEMAYGHALALYRLGKHDPASTALREAKIMLPEVARALSAAKFKAPKLSGLGTVTVGGKDQAAFYRDDMLDVWENTPGAMAWLRQRS